MSIAQRRRKPYGGIQMEGPIARWYARTTRDRRDYPITARAIAAQLPDGGDVLEVAPGPGYLAIELARLGSTKHSPRYWWSSALRFSARPEEATTSFRLQHGVRGIEIQGWEHRV